MTVEQSNAMTMEQVLAEYQKALDRLAPAVLAHPNESNGLLISAYLKKNNLMPPTADNFSIAIKALFKDLTWDKKPKALLLIEKADAPKLKENPLELEAVRTTILKALEVSDAKEKANAASIKQARSLIEGYRPTKFALGNSRIDNAEIEAMAPKWTAALNEAIAKKQNMQQFVLVLSAAIQKRYADRERISERGR
jgi:hypothetical protein